MVDPKYLSNKELVNEYHKCRNVCWSEEEHDRRELLRDEILKRLNESWRMHKKNESLDTQGMLLAIIKLAESHGHYDVYDRFEIEYREIVEKAKAFNKKVKKIYDNFKEVIK